MMRELDIGAEGGEFGTWNRAFVIQDSAGWNFAIESRPRSGPARGSAVLVPPYGINSHEYFLFAHHLLENGFNVVRFDGINNVGLSSGHIDRYTMGQLERDLGEVLAAFFSEPRLPLVLVSQSLSFPVALKQASRDRRVSKLLSLLGVVDVKDTVERVCKSSLDPYFAHDPSVPRCLPFFGHLTDAHDFADDIVAKSYTRPANLVPYFEALTAPLYMVASQADEYVRFEDVARLRRYADRLGRFVTLPDAGHMIGRSVAIAKALAKMTVEFAGGSEREVRTPPLTETIRLASMEASFLNRCERLLPRA
jgi:acyl transferase